MEKFIYSFYGIEFKTCLLNKGIMDLNKNSYNKFVQNNYVKSVPGKMLHHFLFQQFELQQRTLLLM